MTIYKLFAPFLALLILQACSGPSIVEVNVTNELALTRENETIEVELNELTKLYPTINLEKIVVEDGNSSQVLLSQLVDLDGNGLSDQLIFQSDFAPGENKHFHLKEAEGTNNMPSPQKSTYARFVPERIDDFAWENDKVAFRTYGPKAQELTETGQPGGTLSSGIDCWLKRVEYPIIDKWYKQDLEEKKSYHIDHGEGLDNYHVGPSRGTGGTGIWKDDSLLASKNFISWKIIANGPIRTIFELNYGTWDAAGLPVQEIKHISIDLGSNLFKNTLLLGNYNELPNIALGIALHEKKGSLKTDVKNGWFRYLEPHDDSQLATAIVVDPSNIIEYKDYRVDVSDLSNLILICEPKAEVTYYAGFAWGKSGQFDLPEGFDKYLNEFAERIASPLKVEIPE